MMKWLSKLLDRLFALIGALIFLQFPQFVQQYTQQLQGHVAELSIQVSLIEKNAKQSNKTMAEFIKKFSSSSDNDFSRQGNFLQNMVDRLNEMNESLYALQNASVWKKPYVFLSHVSPSIARETLSSYQPGLAFNLENLFYLLAGLLFGSFIYMTLRKLLQQDSAVNPDMKTNP